MLIISKKSFKSRIQFCHNSGQTDKVVINFLWYFQNPKNYAVYRMHHTDDDVTN